MRISDWSSDVCSSDLLEAQTGKGEGVARGQRAREIFLDLAEPPAVFEAHVGHRRLDDDPRVQPVLRGEPRMRDPPLARHVGSEAAEAGVAFESLAAVAHEAAQPCETPSHDPAGGRAWAKRRR